MDSGRWRVPCASREQRDGQGRQRNAHTSIARHQRRHGFDHTEHVRELGTGQPLGAGDPLDAGSPDVHHRISVKELVDDGVAVVAGQRVELAGNGGELPAGGLELSGEDLDLRSRGLERVDATFSTPAEPLS